MDKVTQLKELTLRLNEHWRGREASERDVNELDYDVDQAITSFDSDPPDSAYQRGYLRGLIKCGYATVSSKWEIDLEWETLGGIGMNEKKSFNRRRGETKP
tara:strand:- start:2733 stop:3035 length:303 start_codon:yes stop_codon:yes gene_type:complete